MVCAYCGSDAHVTGYKECPKYCTVCAASGHSRNTNACPNRICSKCHATGHMARQCIFCDTCQTNHDKNTCCTVCVTTGQCRNTNACPNRLCTKCQATGHNARQCTFCDTCQTNHARANVRISNAHIARNTVMMRSDVLKSPHLCAMHAAPARTKRKGQSIVRSTNAQRAKAN